MVGSPNDSSSVVIFTFTSVPVVDCWGLAASWLHRIVNLSFVFLMFVTGLASLTNPYNSILFPEKDVCFAIYLAIIADVAYGTDTTLSFILTE
ncbi:hypothetical protein D0T60_05310 [Bacteroides sp. 224]|nr:hypothetical protein [Bacteroides sp. 224]